MVALSEKFEVSGRGPGTVSTGVGDPSGPSYGCYQMTSKPHGGTVSAYVTGHAFPWRAQFTGLQAGTKEFNAAWEQVAREHPQEFQESQHQFIRQQNYDPLVHSVLAERHVDLDQRSETVRNVVRSTAVQHGPGNGRSIVNRALDRLTSEGIEQAKPKFEEHLINAIYDERGRTDKSGNLVHFKHSAPKVRKDVAARYKAERREGLQMLQTEQEQVRREHR